MNRPETLTDPPPVNLDDGPDAGPEDPTRPTPLSATPATPGSRSGDAVPGEEAGTLGAVLRAFRPTNRDEASLFLSGINLMLANFIMVQHATVAFRRAEIAVIAFSLAYFLGVSAGYFVSDRLRPETLRRGLPAFLGVQLVLLAVMQPLHVLFLRVAQAIGIQGYRDDFVAGFAIFAILAAFVTSLYAVFLPRVIANTGGGLRRPYSVEVAGSLTGLVLMPFLAAISHEAVIGAYILAYLALMAVLGTSRRLVWSLAVGAALFLAVRPAIDRAGAVYTYRHVYGWRVQEVPLTRYTPYHKIEVVRASGENRLLLNGLRQFGGDPRRTYSYFVAEVPARIQAAKSLPRVALLGCGSMATVGRIGDFVGPIRIVDLDPAVFEAASEFFQGLNRLDQLHNWTFTADDAKHWIANTSEQFDLILHDIPPARSRQVALTYTDDFFRLVKARLAPGGVFSISSLTPTTGDTQYGRRMLATLTSVFDRYYALERKGSLYFYGGGPDLVEPDPAHLQAIVAPDFRQDTRALNRAELQTRAEGARVITISNVGDLIYD